LTDKFSTVSREYELKISTKKTKVLVASTEATCDEVCLEQVRLGVFATWAAS